MIYSCTLFLNEFDLLNLKLEEELDVVDKFIIVESNMTFSGKEKDFLLDLNHPKIEVIQVPKEQLDFSGDPYYCAWIREEICRNAAAPINVENNDVIIISDIDEIHHKEEIESFVEPTIKYGFINLLQKVYYYKINLNLGMWKSAKCISGSLFNLNKNLNYWRNKEGLLDFPTNGKHFSYLGDAEQISKKISSYAHIEYDTSEYNNIDHINECILNAKDIFNRFEGKQFIITDIDNTYPKSILNNINYWKKYIFERKI